MAVSSVTPLPKSQPDVGKINSFGGCIVTVTKHLGPRGTVGTSIISSKTMTKEQVLALPELLPSMPGAGPGYYNFSVTDAAGSGDDTWLVKLGPDIPPQQEFSMAGSNGASPPTGFAGAPSVPMDGASVTQILPGWYYNSALALLYTPWRETVTWNQGDPLPKAPAQTAHTPFVPPPSQWGQTPQMGGWGGYPVQSEDNSKIRALEERLAEERASRREQDMRAENARRDAEVRQMIADSNARFEKLIEKLATKPAGDSPELIAIRQQNENLQRQLEQDRRDVQAREQAAQMREEMRRSKEDTDRIVREITANKSDPMLTMMLQMMQQSNQAGMEAVKAITAATGAANTSNERQVQSLVEQMRGTIISPLQMMEMMRSSRGDGAEMSKMVLETTKEMNALQRNVFEQLLDASSGGNQPAWLQAVQAAMEKIGPIGEALAQRASQPKVIRVAVPVDAATGRPIAQGPMQQPNAGAIAGAPGVAPPQGTAATEIRNSPTEAAPAAAPVGKKTRTNKKKGQQAAKGHTLAEIRAMDPDVLSKEVEDISDEDLFGETLLGYVNLIRENVGKGMLPEQVAGTLWDYRPQLLSLTPLPGAVELFMAEQISVLVERLLPDVDQAFHDKVVEGLEERLVAEAEGTEE